MPTKAITKTIFCASEQVETKQTLEVNHFNAAEMVATCECGRQLKFSNSDALAEQIKEHNRVNAPAGV